MARSDWTCEEESSSVSNQLCQDQMQQLNSMSSSFDERESYLLSTDSQILMKKPTLLARLSMQKIEERCLEMGYYLLQNNRLNFTSDKSGDKVVTRRINEKYESEKNMKRDSPSPCAQLKNDWIPIRIKCRDSGYYTNDATLINEIIDGSNDDIDQKNHLVDYNENESATVEGPVCSTQKLWHNLTTDQCTLQDVAHRPMKSAPRDDDSVKSTTVTGTSKNIIANVNENLESGIFSNSEPLETLIDFRKSKLNVHAQGIAVKGSTMFNEQQSIIMTEIGNTSHTVDGSTSGQKWLIDHLDQRNTEPLQQGPNKKTFVNLVQNIHHSYEKKKCDEGELEYHQYSKEPIDNAGLQDLQYQSQQIDPMVISKDHLNTQLVNSDGNLDCSACNVTVLLSESKEWFINLDDIPYFDGCIKNVRCTVCHGKRSDLSLLMGLLHFCQEIVCIRQCCILQRQESLKEYDDFRITLLCDMIITVTFPYWFVQVPDQVTGLRSILPTHSQFSKLRQLHPATQSLLAMIHSNWNAIERFMYDQRDSLDCEKLLSKTTSLFPTHVTLEEVYHRAPSSNLSKFGHSWSSFHSYNQLNKSTTRRASFDSCPEVSFQFFPLDILKINILPYLNARSLHSLRCTCKDFFKTFEDFVPGLSPSIKLYHHQVSSLRWMRKRERKLLTERLCINDQPVMTNIDSDEGDDDYHRAVTGGQTVRLVIRKINLFDVIVSSLRNSSNESNLCNKTPVYVQGSSNVVSPEISGRTMTKSIRLDQVTGQQVLDFVESYDLSRTVARGGLLCDDPGLGKTITVLSLILQTNGISTNPTDCKISRKVPRGGLSSQRTTIQVESGSSTSRKSSSIFYAYWRESVVVEFRIPALLKLLNQLSKVTCSGALQEELRLLKIKVSSEGFGEDFLLFQELVEQKILECTPTKFGLLDAFHELIESFQSSQLQSAKKSFSNTKTRPNSIVAQLIAQEKRDTLISSLYPSSATLLVIPSVLIEHWQTQISLHVDLRYFTNNNKIPLIFEYERNDNPEGPKVMSAIRKCQVLKTHFPVIFYDKSGTKHLPSPEFIAMFRIVVTTTNRFTCEWNNGSFQSELDRSKKNEDDSELTWLYRKSDACSLLKIHWLRMIVDEGHSMANNTKSSTIQFASWIQSERRWAMTGTPTKQTNVQINQIFNLLSFLQHGLLDSQANNEWCRRNIVRSWRSGNLVAFFRMCSLLDFLMKRHTKSNLLVSPQFKESVISMSFTEAVTYNTLVSGIQANIIACSMNGKTSGLQDSLLHESQSTNARLALQNVRRVCIGWAHVVPTLSEINQQLTMQCAEQYGISDEASDKILRFLAKAQNEELSDCAVCGIQVTILLLMPCCGGMVCSECMTSTTTICLLCDSKFDVDDFQKFQPGFTNVWQSNLVIQRTALPLVATTSSHNLSLPNAARDSDAPMLPIPERRRTRKVGDGHNCAYDNNYPDGRCIFCLEEHPKCNLNSEGGRCAVCYRYSEDCPEHESKSFYLIKKFEELTTARRGSCPSIIQTNFNFTTRPIKAIVFSQFRAALNVVGDRLLRKFGTACIAEYTGKNRSRALHQFTFESDCFCLLLTKDGSEGLDLSFVTHIFFLEVIYDQSVEDQAIARAWRMGATGPVEIETLIANNTVEVDMRRFKRARSQGQVKTCYMNNSSLSFDTLDPGIEEPNDKQKLKSLLRSLRLITDYHCFGKPGQKSSLPTKEAPTKGLIESISSQMRYNKSERDTERKRTVRFQL